MENSQISVVIPFYNSNFYIGRALDSVIAQSCKPYEVILIDDCSTDQSISSLRNIVTKYQEKLNIALVSLDQNRGVGNARNVGWSMAKGEFIAFLDSDDAWHPKKLEIQKIFLNNHKNIDLVGSLSNRHNEYEIPLMPGYDDLKFLEVKLSEMIYGNPMHISSIMVRSRVPIRFVDNQRYMEDHRFLLELYVNKFCIYKCQNNFSTHFKYSYGDIGLSSNLLLMEKHEIINFFWIYQQKYISTRALIFALFYSVIRFARRCILVIIRGINPYN